MKPISISTLTICGLEELDSYSARGVTHVLSILDPDWPEPKPFWAYDPHHRTTLHFHDAIEPAPGIVLPEPEHVDAILDFGRNLGEDAAYRDEGHLLVHCHMGVSRSTAAMAMLLAQVHPGESEEGIFQRIISIRPQAWPNLRMIEFADDLLGRAGRLTSAAGQLYARQLADKPHLGEVMRRLNRVREVDLAERS